MCKIGSSDYKYSLGDKINMKISDEITAIKNAAAKIKNEIFHNETDNSSIKSEDETKKHSTGTANSNVSLFSEDEQKIVNETSVYDDSDIPIIKNPWYSDKEKIEILEKKHFEILHKEDKPQGLSFAEKEDIMLKTMMTHYDMPVPDGTLSDK
jgi:hypothetical protein